MPFELLGPITDAEVIAVGRRIREFGRITRRYGAARWRKMKGRAYDTGCKWSRRAAELHWYEAHGVGRKELKRKRWLE